MSRAMFFFYIDVVAQATCQTAGVGGSCVVIGQRAQLFQLTRRCSSELRRVLQAASGAVLNYNAEKFVRDTSESE